MVICVFIPERLKARNASHPGTGQSTKSLASSLALMDLGCEEEACRAAAKLPRASRLLADSVLSLGLCVIVAMDCNVRTVPLKTTIATNKDCKCHSRQCPRHKKLMTKIPSSKLDDVDATPVEEVTMTWLCSQKLGPQISRHQ